MGPRDEERDVLRLEVSEDSGRAVVRASGEVDLDSSSALRAALARLLVAGRHIVLDLSGVTFIDASGIGVLVGARRSAVRSGLTLALRRPSPVVKKVLEVTSVLRFIPVEPAQSAGAA
jgi:anti-anti-sigma factor